PPGWKVEPQLFLGKDTARSFQLELADNVSTFSSVLPITIQSTDPSRLLVSKDATTPGSPAVPVTLAVGNRSPSEFFIQALDHQGSVKLMVSAPGFADAYFDIPLADTFLGIQFGGAPPQTGRILVQGGAVQGRIGFGTGFLVDGGSAVIRP